MKHLAPSLLALVLLSGCAQTQIYKATELPPEFAAPPVRSLRTMDLSAIAQPAPPNNIIQIGDVVEVAVATGLEVEETPRHVLRVAEDGMAVVPLVGPVQLAGLELTQAEQAIARESIRRGIYRSPNVSVLLKQRRMHRITVVGEVESPGVKEIPAATSDLLSALVAAGGLTERADSMIEIRQPNEATRLNAGVHPASHQFDSAPPRVQRVDLTRLQAAPPSDLYIEDGATVVVQKRPEEMVYVMGLVTKPDQFPMPLDQELRLLDAIAMAGGTTLSVVDRVQVIRQVPGEEQPIVISASISEAKKRGAANIRLAPGDVISVEETPLTFTVDLIRNFIRFGFTSAIPGL